MVFSINLAPAYAAGDKEVKSLTSDQIAQLSYLQVKGTGLANRCPDVIGTNAATIPIKDGGKITNLCVEPIEFGLNEELPDKKGNVSNQYVAGKVMTRQTYTLTGMDANLEKKGDDWTLTENDGIDYAPATIQIPGGERVPFLFTVKDLVASGKGDAFKQGLEFGGKFKVPSYRTGLFLDPKGRGATTGYDMAVALPGMQSGVDGDQELFNENNKVFNVDQGSIEFEVKNVNPESSEISGIFIQTQPSDTDMGSKAPKTMVIRGKFSAFVDNEV